MLHNWRRSCDTKINSPSGKSRGERHFRSFCHTSRPFQLVGRFGESRFWPRARQIHATFERIILYAFPGCFLEIPRELERGRCGRVELPCRTYQRHSSTHNLFKPNPEWKWNKGCRSAEFSRWRDLSVNTAPAKCVAVWPD